MRESRQITRWAKATFNAAVAVLLAACATPNFMSADYLAAERGNDYAEEGEALAQAQKWSEAEKALTAALEAYKEQQKYNMDRRRHRVYGTLGRVQAALRKCDDAGYSMRSAINIVLTTAVNVGAAEERVRTAQDYILTEDCRLASGESLAEDGRRFLKVNAPRAVVAAIDSARLRVQAAKEAADDKRRDQEGMAQLQSVIGFAAGVAANIDASKSRTAALKAANRDAAAREQEYRASLQRSNVSPSTGGWSRPPTATTNPIGTAGQMQMGSARDIGSNPRGSRQAPTMESCKCGPDYIPCHVRNAKRSGERYQVSADGRHIVTFARDGMWSGKKGWNKDNSCSGVVS